MNPEADSVTITVRVRPRASRNSVALQPDGSLTIRLTALPVKGAANKALIKFLADTLRLPKGAFEICRGESSHNKVIRISGCNRDVLLSKLSTVK
jgi:hypothetical protein